MADNLKRSPRIISFRGGLITDSVDQQNPVFYLENLLPKTGEGDGLIPRTGISPLTNISTEETEGCVVFLVTLQGSKNRQLVVMMNASTRRIISIDDYVEQEGRRAVPPDSGDYPAPTPPPTGSGLRFVEGYSSSILGAAVVLSVAGSGEGGQCYWTAYFKDDDGIIELDEGTVTASAESNGTIGFVLPETANGTWSVYVYLYDPQDNASLSGDTLHYISEAVMSGLWNPLALSNYDPTKTPCNFFNKDAKVFKGLYLEPSVSSSSTYVRSWRCYNTPYGYMLAVLRFKDSSGLKFYVDVYTMTDINSTPNNGTIQAAYTFDVADSNEDGNDNVSLGFGYNNTELGVVYLADEYTKIVYYDITTGSNKGDVVVSNDNYAMEWFDYGAIWGNMFRWSYSSVVGPKMLDLRGSLIPVMRTLDSDALFVKQIDAASGGSGNYEYKAGSVRYYNHVNNTYGSPINLPSGIDLEALDISRHDLYENRNVLSDGTDVLYFNDYNYNKKLLFVNVLGGNVKHDSVRYRWVDLSDGYSEPVMLGFSDSGSKFYAIERKDDDINLFIYDLVNKTSEALPVLGGTTSDFIPITSGGLGFGSIWYNSLPPAQYGNWII